MCYYYPDAAKLGGAIMAGEGSTSAPSECFWWQVFLLPIWTSLTGLVLYLGMDLEPSRHCLAFNLLCTVSNPDNRITKEICKC
jgi:hypothetical protein